MQQDKLYYILGMCSVRVKKDPSIYAVTILKIALCIAEEILPEITFVPGNIRRMIELAKEHRFGEIEQYATEDQIRKVIIDDPKASAKFFLHSAKSIASEGYNDEIKKEFVSRIEIGWNILKQHSPETDWGSMIMEEEGV